MSIIIMINQLINLFKAFNLLMSYKNLLENENENLNFFMTVTEALNKCFRFFFQKVFKKRMKILKSLRF